MERKATQEEKMMAFDFKKAFKAYYQPKTQPEIVNLPAVNYISVRGSGDPNLEDGDYQKAVSVLYAVAYTIKMSKMGSQPLEGYFDFVVPPLEGFWWQDGVTGIDYAHKAAFNWISVIRLPEFVTPQVFAWAVDAASQRKKIDCSCAKFLTVEEGLCVQMMHTGSYDAEPETVSAMDRFAIDNGYALDLNEQRLHHEIYLSDPRKTAPEKLKTVIRHPIKKA